MRDLAKELRIGLRTLGRRPGIAVVAVAILALGIGANTAVFSAMHAVLVAPLPYPDAERLVQVWNRYPLMDIPQGSVSIPDYLDRRARVPAFAQTALYSFQGFNLSLDGAPERAIGIRPTASDRRQPLFPSTTTGIPVT